MSTVPPRAITIHLWISAMSSDVLPLTAIGTSFIPQRSSDSPQRRSGELLEHFQWCRTPSQRFGADAVRRFARNSLTYCCISFGCRQLDVELTTAAADKIRINAIKYPVEKCRGSHKKYTEL